MYQDQLQKAYAMFREKNHDERVWFNDFCFVCFIEFRAKFNPRLNWNQKKRKWKKLKEVTRINRKERKEKKKPPREKDNQIIPAPQRGSYLNQHGLPWSLAYVLRRGWSGLINGEENKKSPAGDQG